MKYAFEVPTKEKWDELMSSFPFDALYHDKSSFPLTRLNSIEGVRHIAKIRKISSWQMAIHNKWNDVARCFGMLVFLHELGIPDEPYAITSDKENLSIEYFPKMTVEDHIRKGDFDFYADIFFLKVFSIYDNLWQLLNVYCDCGLAEDRVYRKRLFSKLGKKNTAFSAKLERILIDPRYKRGEYLRHSIAHRLPIGSQGSGVKKEGNATIFGASEYLINVKETVKAARDLIDFSAEAYIQIKAWAAEAYSGPGC